MAHEYFASLHISMSMSTRPGYLSVEKRNEYQRKLGSKQAHRAMH